MSASVRSVRLSPAGMRRLEGPRGEVGRYLSRVGGYVTREAISLSESRLTSTRGDGGYISRFKTTTIRGRVTITNDSEHATFIENGTPPHLILPRNGTHLRFQTDGGDVVFAKRVMHPGTKPQRVMTDALRLGLRRAGA